MDVNAPLAVRLAVLKKALARVRAKARLDGDIVGNDFTVDLLTPVRQARPQPCSHPGCSSHVSHPCEGCGYMWGKGERDRTKEGGSA